MKCANCPSDAVHLVSDPGALPQAFCDADLPEFLRPRANLGNLHVLKHVTFTAQPDPLAKVARVPKPRKR